MINKLVLLQLIRFGMIGVTGAAVHFGLVLFFVEINGLNPLFANLVAFLFSFQVSYYGHRLWTFRGTVVRHRTAMPRLLLLQVGNLFLNEALFYCLMTYFNLSYQIALLVVLATLPIITFTVSRIWIFR